jgi:hypothetical protein
LLLHQVVGVHHIVVVFIVSCSLYVRDEYNVANTTT